MTRFTPAVEPLEARVTPAAPAYFYSGVVHVAGGGALDRFVHQRDGTDASDFRPFDDDFAGEVRTAQADLTADGLADLIVAAGPGGGSRVRVFDGRTGEVLRDFFAFGPNFRGGVYVAAADVDGDTQADLIVGAGEGGGPRVLVFTGATSTVFADFLAFEPDFRGGVRVAGGNIDFSHGDDVIVAAGPGGTPRVSVYSAEILGGFNPVPRRLTEAYTFLAYDASLRTGVHVTTVGGEWGASGGRSVFGGMDVVTAPGAGGAPHVKVFDGATGAEEASFLLGDPAGRSGLRVTGNRDGLVGEWLTPTGPAVVLVPRTGGEVYWSLPPGAARVGASVVSVAADAMSLTVSTAGAGTRVIPVRADAAVRRSRTWESIRLEDIGEGNVSILLGADGAAVEVLYAPPISSPPPPPPILQPPPPPIDLPFAPEIGPG